MPEKHYKYIHLCGKITKNNYLFTSVLVANIMMDIYLAALQLSKLSTM